MGGVRRNFIGAFGAIAVAAALFFAFRSTPVLVEIAEVTEGDFRAIVEEDGKTRVRNRYVVAAPVSGRLLRVSAKAGDEVVASSVIASIAPAWPTVLDPRAKHEAEQRVGAAEAAVAEAAARVERAQAVLAKSRLDLQRAFTLEKRGAATTQRREGEELNVQVNEREAKAAELRKHAAEHELDAARAQLRRFGEKPVADRWEVIAPVSGRVMRVVQESETTIAAGAPLIEIGDPSDLEVVVDLLTADAVKVSPGAEVELLGWGGAALKGRVRRVEPGAFTKVSALGVEEQRVFVIIDIASVREEWAALGDGFRVDVRIATQVTPRATLAPVAALFRREGGWAVFVVEGDMAHERQVDVNRSGRTAAVRSGLRAGERIVIFPPNALKDGDRVQQP